MRFLATAGLVGLLGSIAPLPAQNWDAVEIKTHEVAGNVYMLIGQGGNIGVSAGEDGLLIVDDQFAPLAGKIRAALAAIGGDGGELAFVLNTHWHGDHTGGNVEFGPEATIIAHINVRERLSKEQTIRGNTVPASPPEALPVITFEDRLSVHFNGEEIRMIHLPSGHTDGDSVIYFVGSNVLHMGDHFFAGRFPFIDLGSGGNALGMAENIGTVIERVPADVKIIPGHGPLSTIEDLRLYHRMLNECIDAVRAGVGAGKSLEQIKADGLPSEWKDWGSGFISEPVFTEFIYRSLWR